MATDRAAGTMIYRCEVPRASRSSVSCSLDDPTATGAAVVAAAVAAAPAAVVAPSAYGVLAWSSVRFSDGGVSESIVFIVEGTRWAFVRVYSKRFSYSAYSQTSGYQSIIHDEIFSNAKPYA
ncbi:hypothetical protein ACI65C_003165 [Semiaphis heraclei]